MSGTLFRIVARGIARIVFPRAKVTRDVPDRPGEAAVYCCNHSQALGPVYMTLYFDRPHRTWIIGHALDKKRRQNFAFHDFFAGEARKCKAFWRALARFVSTFLAPLYSLARPIPVYHNKKMLATFKESVQALRSGESVVIFSESLTEYSEYANKSSEGFCELGRAYFLKTGKRLKFYPCYAEKKNRAIRIGAPVVFNETRPAREERRRIAERITSDMDRLARSLPKKFKPIPHQTDKWNEAYGRHIAHPAEYWSMFD